MKWFYDLKIGTKLLLTFALSALFAASIGFVGMLYVNAISQQSREMYDNMTVPIHELGNVTEAFQRERINSRDMLTATNREEMMSYIATIEQLGVETSKSVAEIEKSLLSQEAKADFKIFADARSAYRSDLTRMVELAKANRKNEAWALLRGDAYRTAKAEQAAIDSLQEKKIRDAAARNESNLADAKAAATTMLAILVTGILSAIALGIFIARMISNPLKEVIRTIENADMNSQFNSQRKDEVGDLHRSFDRFVGSIKQTLLQVSEAATAVASASGEISSSTEQMAAGAQEQTSQAGEVASAVEEMTKTIVENSKNANATAEFARKAKSAAEEGVGISQGTLDAIRRNVEVAGEVGTIVNELGRSSEKIGDIITVIDDIADQTNLLALNAAIEAARAGEQGRGFAVVADEVRKLAERTTKATKEIAELIKGIQSLTSKGVASMEKAGVIVGENRDMTNKTAEALQGIVAMSTQVTDMVVQIAAASEEQSSASEQISKNVEAISTVTGETAAGTQQIARAAEDLNRLTERLQQLVDKFSLSGGDQDSQQTPARSSHTAGRSGQQKSNTAVRANGVLVTREASGGNL